MNLTRKVFLWLLVSTPLIYFGTFLLWPDTPHRIKIANDIPTTIQARENTFLSKPTCKSSTQIVFIKTYKTASTTTNTIVQAYGVKHNLSFALPVKGSIFSEIDFSRDLLAFKAPPTANSTGFDIVAFHLRYNRKELDKVVPGAKYITIIREPVSKFESTFGFFDIPNEVHLSPQINQLHTFMRKPDYYYARYKSVRRNQLRNGLMYSLGFDHKYDDNQTMIEKTIEELDKELDLVMLVEYYDESLLLMKKVLCWEFEDILYIPKGARSSDKRHVMTTTDANRILKWNNADIQLYNHFNRTFWKKVQEYGPDFDKDLKTFREMQNRFYNKCVDPNVMRYSQERESAHVMRENATIDCQLAFMRFYEYRHLLHKFAKGKQALPEKFMLKSYNETADMKSHPAILINETCSFCA